SRIAARFGQALSALRRVRLAYVWHRANPCVPNIGIGAAADISYPSTTRRHPLWAVPNQGRLAALIWTELFSVYPSPGPFAPAGRAGKGWLNHAAPSPPCILLPTWFCQPRTASSTVRVGSGVCQRDWPIPRCVVLPRTQYERRGRADGFDTASGRQQTQTMPFYLVLHAPHSSAASPRLVMELGSCFQGRFR
ncbi:hypothetical protein N5P37_007033, partial [Trichoderma harzianum]